MCEGFEGRPETHSDFVSRSDSYLGAVRFFNRKGAENAEK
jgi:hypothetical protein